jgi:hypothetical protein
MPSFFFKSAAFKERIFRTIQNPLEQLELDRHHNRDKVSEDLSVLSGLRKVTLYGWKINIFPLGLWELALEECTLMSDNFPEVRKFRCDYFTQTHDLDANGLKILEEASFGYVNLLNYHTLSHLKALTIDSSESIADVSCFRNIQKLSLSNCNNITDVSSLGSVQELNFSRCPDIRDVSAFCFRKSSEAQNLLLCKHSSRFSVRECELSSVGWL